MNLETQQDGQDFLDQLVDQVASSVQDEGLLRGVLRMALSQVWKAGNESGQPIYDHRDDPGMNPFRGTPEALKEK